MVGDRGHTVPRETGLLKRVAEHDLRDSHEAGLCGDLAEVRAAHVVGTSDPANVDAVEQVQHLDFQLCRVRPSQSEILDEHRIGIVLRRRAHVRDIPRRIAEGQTEKVIVEPGDVMSYLGPPRFEFGVAELEDQVGAVTGVAVNEYGGDVMTVEAILMQGRGEFALTGQIGKVMEESARAAVSYARSHALELGLKPGFFEDHFFHIHVPAGAIPKDGPSAGITMATAVVSVLTDRPVRREVAMTGEITLRGKVLPIGGLKEKLLAAHRAGIKTFILPEKNRKDLHEVPEEVKNSMELVLVKHVDEVLEKALLPAATRPSTPGLGFKRPLGGSQPGTVN